MEINKLKNKIVLLSMSLIPIAFHKDSGDLIQIDPEFKSNTHGENYDYETDELIQLLPSFKEDDRDTFWLGGAPGSGKTYFITEYILQYMQHHPHNRVFIFTPKPDDKTLEPVRGSQNVSIINLNAKTPDGQSYFLQHFDKIDPSYFKNSLVFVDDRIGILEKDVKKAVDQMDEQILKIGREYNTTLAVSHHEITDYGRSRDYLANCKYVVAFPLGGGQKILMNYLKNYMNLKPDKIDDLLNKKSRTLVFKQTIPQYVLHEHGVVML